MYDIYVFSSMLYVVFFTTVMLFLLISIKENKCCQCCSKKEIELEPKCDITEKTSVEEQLNKKDTDNQEVEPTKTDTKKGHKKTNKPVKKPTIKKHKIKKQDSTENIPTVDTANNPPLKEQDIKKTLAKNGSIHIFYNHKSVEKGKQEVTLYDGKARLLDTIYCNTNHLKKLNVLMVALLEILKAIPETYKKESVIKINTNSIELLRKWTTIKINYKNGVLEDAEWLEVLDNLKGYEIILTKTKKVA